MKEDASTWLDTQGQPSPDISPLSDIDVMPMSKLARAKRLLKRMTEEFIN